jgi:hypothetical protein
LKTPFYNQIDGNFENIFLFTPLQGQTKTTNVHNFLIFKNKGKNGY